MTYFRYRGFIRGGGRYLPISWNLAASPWRVLLYIQDNSWLHPPLPHCNFVPPFETSSKCNIGCVMFSHCMRSASSQFSPDPSGRSWVPPRAHAHQISSDSRAWIPHETQRNDAVCVYVGFGVHFACLMPDSNWNPNCTLTIISFPDPILCHGGRNPSSPSVAKKNGLGTSKYGVI